MSLLSVLSLGSLPAAQNSFKVGSHHHHHHSSSSSSDYQKLLGTFSIIGFAEHHSVELSNYYIYEPVNKRYKKEVAHNWVLGQQVSVVRSSHKHIYVLTNLATGNVIKAKLLHLK